MSDAETLLAQAVAAVNAGDLTTAADRFERAATILGGVSPRDAVSALESAARLRLMTADPRRAALSVARAKKLEPDSGRVERLNAEVVDASGDLPARQAAWQAVLLTEDPAQRQHAHLQLAAIERAANQHALAADHFEAALADVAPNDPPTLAAELWLEIAVARTAAKDPEGAEAALVRADAAIPNDVGDEADGMRGRIMGQRGVLAFDTGDLETALAHGQAARDSAVARADVMTYLGAASLIAMVHERANRLIDAYDTYIRARESLGQLLGDDGRAMIQPAVQLFEERLGPEPFKLVWDEWVARRRAAQS